MRALEDRGFVLFDDVSAAPIGNGSLQMKGTIECLGGIEVTVDKILRVEEQPKGEPTVQTIDYHYNARLKGVGNILRYDSPHFDHNGYHHVHRFDVFNGDNTGTLTECEWPTLGRVLEELEQWYYDNQDRLS